MAGSSLIYSFEGLAADLPRPSMAALRALLSSGVLVSARAWQELTPATRQEFGRLGAAERLDEKAIAELLKSVPVSQLKLIGKKVDPSPDEPPAALVAAVGRVRPLTALDWRGLRAVDRYVLEGLVKNTRLLWRALDEMLPRETDIRATDSGSGAVARAELRMSRKALQRALAPDFLDGQAFVLASVAGRRAARRASEMLDLQSDSTVGPVEIDWGVRLDDDTLFWQAHVSAWDGTFFPAAALLAATAAAVAMYDMVKSLDPEVALSKARVRDEPWVAGRNEVAEAATGLYSAAGTLMSPQPPLSDTINDGTETGEAAAMLAAVRALRAIPAALASSPSMAPTPRASTPGIAPAQAPAITAPLVAGLAPSLAPASPRLAPAGSSAPPTPRVPSKRRGTQWSVVAIVSLFAVVNIAVLVALALFLAHSRR